MLFNTSRFHGVLSAGLVGASVLLGTGLASAQTQGRAWALDRYDPTPAGDSWFIADRPWYTGQNPVAVRAGVLLDYAHNPLVARSGGQGSGVSTSIVEHMLVLHVQAGISLFDRLNVHLSLPISVFQAGSPTAGLSALSTAAVGDPRLGFRVRIAGRADKDPASLHFGGNFYFNAGLFGLAPSTNTTDGNFRGKLYLTGAGRVGPFAWSLNFGAHLRESYNTAAVDVASELYLNAGVGILADSDRLNIGVEASTSTTIGHFFEYRYFNAELLGGIRYTIADTIMVGAGAGPGLSQGAGTPDVRALFQLAYAPIQREKAPAAPDDRDHDGVADPDDLCPSTAAGEHPDPNRRGCPEGDKDGDGVLDTVDQCPETAAGEHPDPARAGCPEGDRDSDGVLDSQDQCADTPAGEYPDPDKRGCPDGDRDSDGVINTLDQCPDQPQGGNPDPNRRGCPIPDRDGDTVPDEPDHCPDQPGVPSSDPARNGCPDGQVAISNCEIHITAPVYFATNRDVILPRSFPTLTAVQNALQNAPSIRRVSIEGHTDDRGDDNRNMDLSNRRAISVMRWLTEHAIASERLEAHGYGETRPLRDIRGLRARALRDARSENRRVQFRIVDGGPNCGGAGGGGQ